MDVVGIGQVLENLVSNAIKNSPDGGTVTVLPRAVRTGGVLGVDWPLTMTLMGATLRNSSEEIDAGSSRASVNLKVWAGYRKLVESGVD